MFKINLSPLVGIDLGSQFTRICWLKTQEFVTYPSYIAVNQADGKVVAVGQDALDLKGRTKASVVVAQPIKEGIVHDFSLARTMLQVFLNPFLKTSLVSPNVMVSCPIQSYRVDQKMLVKLFASLGANQVYLISEPLAAAIGSGVPIADASGAAFFQLGADLAQASVISLGSNIRSAVLAKAGNYADRLVKLAVRRNNQLILSLKVAEQIKHKAGLLGLQASNQETAGLKILVAGKDRSQQSPKEVEIPLTLLSQSLQPLVDEYVILLKQLLSDIPPDLAVDVIDKGLLLSGGGANLPGLVDYFTTKLGINVALVDEPGQAGIKGIATALEHLDEFKQSQGYQRVH